MLEGGADVEAIPGTKVPRIARIGLVAYEDFASKGDKWCGIVTMGEVEVLPGGDGSI